MRALTEAGVTLSEWAGFLVLYAFADPKGKCFPADSTVAELLPLAESSIYAIRKGLREAGLVEWDVYGHGRTNSYRLALPAHGQGVETTGLPAPQQGVEDTSLSRPRTRGRTSPRGGTGVPPRASREISPRSSRTKETGNETGRRHSGEQDSPQAGRSAPLQPTDDATKGAEETARRRYTDDPMGKRAHELTSYAFSKPPWHSVEWTNKKPKFVAVLSLIHRQLEAGTPATEIRRAIDNGVDVWTQAGLQLAIVRAKPAPRLRGVSNLAHPACATCGESAHEGRSCRVEVGR